MERQAVTEKKNVQIRIRPELLPLIEEALKKFPLKKTQFFQLAIGDFVGKMLSEKMPEWAAKGQPEPFNPESITDHYIKGILSGMMNYTHTGFYLDVDLPKSQQEEEK